VDFGPDLLLTEIRIISKQVSVEPPPSALDVTLSAFADERRRACNTAPARAHNYRSISPARWALSSKPPAAVATVDPWDRQTDGQTSG